jgi:phosphopantothenoylcysteine synthetase/decarboxylase
MTKNATEFITPLTLQVLSSHPVFTDMFRQDIYDINHISLADAADTLVIAPATANIIGKIAAGIADDLLSTVAMAVRAPVLICPAMNTQMYNNPIVGRISGNEGYGVSLRRSRLWRTRCKAEGREDSRN